MERGGFGSLSFAIRKVFSAFFGAPRRRRHIGFQLFHFLFSPHVFTSLSCQSEGRHPVGSIAIGRDVFGHRERASLLRLVGRVDLLLRLHPEHAVHEIPSRH